MPDHQLHDRAKVKNKIKKKIKTRYEMEKNYDAQGGVFLCFKRSKPENVSGEFNFNIFFLSFF